MKPTLTSWAGKALFPFLVAGLACWESPSAALDVTKCKAKINGKDGAVLVQAAAVTGTLLWGGQSGKEIYSFSDNTGDCVGANPKKCQLGAVGTTEQISPPEACIVYIKDTGDSSACSAYIKKCVPGRRPCPSDMVSVGGFCIDKYEMSVWDSPSGVTQYGASMDDYPCSDNGQDCANIYARSVDGVLPSAFLTWFQAQQACGNVGKRLPTNAEWQQAVAGTPDPGPDDGVADCNTASAGTTVNTGSRSACVSTAGVFDMVGNVNERVADWLPAHNSCSSWGTFSDDYLCVNNIDATAFGPGAVLRGGSYGTGTAAGPLAFTSSLPSAAFPGHGFRCAR